MEIENAKFTIDQEGSTFHLYDVKDCHTLTVIADDIKKNTYGVLDLTHPQGYMIDCGAHVGLFSVFLSKRFPEAKILALEPFPYNHRNLTRGLKENNCTNVIPLRLALTKDGRDIALGANPMNTGGANAQLAFEPPNIKSVTLNQLFDIFIPEGEMVSFLKMDIERMEYEVLESFTKWDRIIDLGVEIHDHPDFIKPHVKWKEKIFEMEAWLKTKPIKGKLWFPPRELYDQ